MHRARHKTASKGGKPSSPRGERPGAGYQPALVCLLLLGATILVYWPVARFDFVNFDDDVYVTGNYRVLAGLSWDNIRWAFSNVEAGFWHPLTWLSLMLDASLYAGSSGGFHLTNLLLHAAGTVMLFFALRQMTGALWRSGLVAALFALHPLHVESVAWIAERKDVLSTWFWMLALLLYARHARRQGVAGPDRKPPSLFGFIRSRDYWLAWFFFVCGLMSKSMLVTLPVVLLLLDYWPLQRTGSPAGAPT